MVLVTSPKSQAGLCMLAKCSELTVLVVDLGHSGLQECCARAAPPLPRPSHQEYHLGSVDSWLCFWPGLGF